MYKINFVSESNKRLARDHLLDVRKVNAMALRDKTLTDVIFRVGTDRGSFHAHKLILALRSSVFQVMFYGNLRENDVVEIPDLQPEGFHGLLRYYLLILCKICEYPY